jgi:hypothetical protein
MDWHAMVLLGAYHGINPGMGWLFAVALGLQQGSARGVWCALPPIVLGHSAAIGVVLTIAWLAQLVVPTDTLNLVVALVLIALGVYRLRRHRHPRAGGMQVGFRDLTVWSFLMASAHGAGLMVLQFVMPLSAELTAAQGNHAGHVVALSLNLPAVDAMAVGIHTLSYLLVMALVAWVVYHKLGLALLRKAWFNLDSVWAGALVVTGLIVLVQ